MEAKSKTKHLSTRFLHKNLDFPTITGKTWMLGSMQQRAEHVARLRLAWGFAQTAFSRRVKPAGYIMVTKVVAVKDRLFGLIVIVALFTSCAPIPKRYSVISVPRISGKLVLAKTSHPLPGVSVSFHGKEIKTDSNGKFEFSLVRNERRWCFIHGFPIDRPRSSDHISINVDTLSLDSLGRFENKKSFGFKKPSRDCYELSSESQEERNFELGQIKLFGFPN